MESPLPEIKLALLSSGLLISTRECSLLLWSLSHGTSTPMTSHQVLTHKPSGTPRYVRQRSAFLLQDSLGLYSRTQSDTIGLAHQPMNLSKKVCSQKAAADQNFTSTAELRCAFQDSLISRAGVLSRIAEFYEPAGWWEPVKLQMKLSFQELNSLAWDEQVPDDATSTWIDHFLFIEQTRALSIPRCILPPDSAPQAKIRLICLADVAECAGGTAIYVGVKLQDGSYSCSLLYSKSKLMSHSISRNELEAIVLMADATLTVQKSLGDRVKGVSFYSDIMIAICWVLNTSRRLCMLIHNRVQLIRHGIHKLVDGEEIIPLYHIDGESNLADMVTKPPPIQITDVDRDSAWMTGLRWMRLPTENLHRNQ
jgi:Pao retrotransposon peptidase